MQSTSTQFGRGAMTVAGVTLKLKYLEGVGSSIKSGKHKVSLQIAFAH